MLTREDVIAVASRLFAVYLVVLSVQSIALSVGTLFGRVWETYWIVLMWLLYAATLLIVGLLWFFPLSIARKLLPVARDTSGTPLGETNDLQSIAFSVLGAWVLATALSDVASWLVFFLYIERTRTDYSVSAENTAGIASTVVQFAIGIYLLIGSRGFARLLYRIRYSSN
jgi:hypothetical protein